MKSISDVLPPTFTTETARQCGVHPRDLYAWRDRGDLVELTRGVFRRADAPASYPDALGVAYRSPRAIVCCVSAAAVHDLTDEMPAAVQIAVPKRAHPPVIDHPPVQVFRFEESLFEVGLSSFEAAPAELVRIYDPARTVVDLMRFRRRFGEPVAHGVCASLGCVRSGARGTRCDEGEMTRPVRGTAAGRAYLDLQNRARREKRGTQELLTMYVVERWLARLSRSAYAGEFVLKGGMLLASFGQRRPTVDADALARNISSDHES